VLKWIAGSKLEHALADPKHARALIGELPAFDHFKALEEITGWLESLAELYSVRLDRFFDVVSLLDTTARAHHARLVRDYLGTSRQQKFEEVKLWNCGFKFSAALGEAYLGWVKQHDTEGSATGARRKHSALVIARAFRALALQMKWTMLRYGPFEAKLWRAVGNLYQHAETSQVADVSLPIYPDSDGMSTIRQEYLKLLMLWTSGADVLPPVKQDIAEHVVGYFSPLFEMSNAPFPGALYWFDPAAERAPTRVFGDPPAAPDLTFFGPGSAPVNLAKLIAVIGRTGSLPSRLNLGAAHPDMVVALLRHLARYWSETPPVRASGRRASTARLTVVPGYSALLDELEREEEDALNFTVSNTESWVVEDVSNDGFGALVPASASDWIRVGEIIGVRVEGSQHWGVGLVRRVSRDEEHEYHIGIEMISHKVIVVRISGLGATGDSDTAILLSGTPDANGEVGLVTRAGRFDPKSSVQVNGRTKSYVFVPSRLVDAGDDFDWGTFRIQASPPENPASPTSRT
jgi:hypothetical protein